MKITLLAPFIITFILFIVSCKKDSDPAGASDGNWSVYRTGGFEYRLDVATTTRKEIDGFKVLTATSTEDTVVPKSINLWFKEWPLSTANYKPVEFFSNKHLEDQQVGISLTFPGYDTLYSTGLKFVGFSPEPAPEIKITVNNDKLSIDIPTMSSWMANHRGLDSASFHGIIIE